MSAAGMEAASAAATAARTLGEAVAAGGAAAAALAERAAEAPAVRRRKRRPVCVFCFFVFCCFVFVFFKLGHARAQVGHKGPKSGYEYIYIYISLHRVICTYNPT